MKIGDFIEPNQGITPEHLRGVVGGLYSDPRTFVTKDSGKREEFSSGSLRDTQDGKPRYSLIPPEPLKRLADLYVRGADKYGEYNWTKGQPTSRILDSLMRHVEAYRSGETSEDHLAAIAWNAFAIMHFEGTEFDDKHDWSRNEH